MIVNRIYDWARLQPAKAAFICNGTRINYATFARVIDATRHFLSDKGLSPGRLAIVMAERSSDAWVYVLALRALGLDTACLSSSAAIGELRFRNLACVVLGETEFPAFEPPNGLLDGGATVIVVPRSIYVGIGRLPEPLDGQARAGGHILFTSGTTGVYKMVFQESANEERRNAARASEMLFDRNSIVHMQDMPLWTGAGFKQPSSVWHMGGTVVIDQRPDATKRTFEHRPTHVFVTPPTLASLVDETRGFDPALFRGTKFSSVGGFVPLAIAEEVTGRMESKLYVHYSATETGSLIMRTEFREKDDLSWYVPVPGRMVRIVDEHARDCALGEEGRLGVVLTDIDCTSYLDDDEAGRNVFVDGTFLSGDIAVARGDGRICILGRLDDVVNIGGKKSAVAPIEHSIRDILGVEDVCLFSGLNKVGENEIVVALQSQRRLPNSELESVANKFALGRVRFFTLKKFPRSESGMGKVLRAELRRLAFTNIS